MVVRHIISNMCMSIKTKLIPMFNERYIVMIDVATIADTVSVIVATRHQRARIVTNNEFYMTYHPNFDGGMDPFVRMR